jgi:hypothetical protein
MRMLMLLVALTASLVVALPFSNTWIGTNLRLVATCSGDDNSGLASGVYSSVRDPLYASAIVNPFAAFQEIMSGRGRHYGVWADVFEQVSPCQQVGPLSVVAPDTEPNLVRLVDFVQNQNFGAIIVGQTARGTPLLGGRLDHLDLSIVRPQPGNSSQIDPLPEPTTCSRSSKSMTASVLHEIGHIYGFNHDDLTPNLMNTSGIDVFSCKWFGDTLMAKPDGEMMAAMDTIYGRRQGQDIDLGVTAVIRTMPGSMGVPSGSGKSVDGTGGSIYSSASTPVRPERLRLTVLRLGADTEPFDILVHWTPFPGQAFPSPDLRPSMSGSFVSLVPNLPAPVGRSVEVVIAAVPPVSSFKPNVPYYPVVELFSGNDRDVQDNSLMIDAPVTRQFN